MLLRRDYCITTRLFIRDDDHNEHAVAYHYYADYAISAAIDATLSRHAAAAFFDDAITAAAAAATAGFSVAALMLQLLPPPFRFD